MSQSWLLGQRALREAWRTPDALFPTVCYVAGPSELAYLGQLRGVYEHFGLSMPLIQPRSWPISSIADSTGVRRWSVPTTVSPWKR